MVQRPSKVAKMTIQVIDRCGMHVYHTFHPTEGLVFRPQSHEKRVGTSVSQKRMAENPIVINSGDRKAVKSTFCGDFTFWWSEILLFAIHCH